MLCDRDAHLFAVYTIAEVNKKLSNGRETAPRVGNFKAMGHFEAKF